MSMMCWVQILLYSCLSSVLNASCVWMLVSCFRFETFEATISLKIFLFLLILSQFSSTWILKFGLLVVSQTSWRYWLYSIFFPFMFV